MKLSMKMVIVGAIAALLLAITVISAASAYPYVLPELQGAGTNYYYYGGYAGGYYNSYHNLPTVAGPYPRYYLGYNNYRGNNYYFAHDDFNHFDSFIGYRDLDVYYPDRGYIDVLRNPGASLTPPELPDRVYNSSPHGYNVYGMLPGGAFYEKHYYHDHDWGLGYYGYGSLWGYNFYQPSVAYVNKPVFGHNCFPTQCA